MDPHEASGPLGTGSDSAGGLYSPLGPFLSHACPLRQPQGRGGGLHLMGGRGRRGARPPRACVASQHTPAVSSGPRPCRAPPAGRTPAPLPGHVLGPAHGLPDGSEAPPRPTRRSAAPPPTCPLQPLTRIPAGRPTWPGDTLMCERRGCTHGRRHRPSDGHLGTRECPRAAPRPSATQGPSRCAPCQAHVPRAGRHQPARRPAPHPPQARPGAPWSRTGGI